ncbi:2Fe-2S iron-sulfur cluster-binding protein [Pseudomonas aeruginosa]
MPDIRVGERRLAVAAGSNLLDALLAGGIAVPHGCRAGSCHACLVHCLQGEVDDTLRRRSIRHGAKRAGGWPVSAGCSATSCCSLSILSATGCRPGS